jgi:hypothetical protein
MTTPRRPSLDELAAGDIDAVDLQALDRLAQVYALLDPVPAGLVERVQFGITLDALHAEIAELQRPDVLTGVRTDDLTETHTITFTSSALTTMVTITPLSVDTARVDGWIAPGGSIEVELRSPTGSQTVTADEDGRFVFAEVPRGLAQFVLRPAQGTDGTPVVTPSVEL